MIEQTITLAELGKLFGIEQFDEPFELDIEDANIEILTPNGFKKMTHYVVMPQVETHYMLGDLKATANHRVLYSGDWVTMSKHPDAKKIDQVLDVVDVSVPDGNCFIGNDVVNHNTTPGGKH